MGVAGAVDKTREQVSGEPVLQRPRVDHVGNRHRQSSYSSPILGEYPSVQGRTVCRRDDLCSWRPPSTPTAVCSSSGSRIDSYRHERRVIAGSGHQAHELLPGLLPRGLARSAMARRNPPGSCRRRSSSGLIGCAASASIVALPAHVACSSTASSSSTSKDRTPTPRLSPARRSPSGPFPASAAAPRRGPSSLDVSPPADHGAEQDYRTSPQTIKTQPERTCGSRGILVLVLQRPN